MWRRLDSLIEQAREGLLSALDLAYVQRGFFPGVAAEYKSRLASLGRAQQVSLLERSVKGDDRLYRYELQYEKETLIVTLGLAPDGKVSAFALGPKQPPLGI